MTWTAWEQADLEWEPAWQQDDWGPLRRSTSEAVSDDQGGFQFGDEVASELGTVVWASHPDYTAECRVLTPEDPLSPEGTTIDVAPGQPTRVRVVDAEGRPVPRATVEQFGLTPAGAARGSNGLTTERARRLFVRRHATDETGQCAVGPFPGEQVLLAARGRMRSLPWRGPAAAQVVLTLAGTFTIGGTASFPDWSHLNYQGERRLVVEGLTAGGSTVLASLRPIVDGEWGPLTLPWIEGVSYELHLEGSPIVPLFERFTTPVLDGHLEFHLRPVLGPAVTLQAQDETGHPIPDAEAASYFDDDGVQRVLKRRADAEGFLYNWSFPETAFVRSFVHAPGYAGQWCEVQLPEPQARTHRVVLKHGSSLVGRCLFEGRAIEDFEILVWEPHRPSYTQLARSFRGCRDGRFELQDVPMGDVAVAAATDELPFGQAVHVSLPSRDVIVLDLTQAVAGHGQVIDASNGAPIGDASIQVLVPMGGLVFRPWGQRRVVDQEGRFSVRSFQPGPNTVRVQASGYAERNATGFLRDGEVDFGTIPLDRPKALVLRVVSDAPTDFAGITVFGDENNPLPRRTLDASGAVRYEGLSPGTRLVGFEGVPNATWAFLRLNLGAEGQWSFSHRVSGARRLSIDIVGKSDEAPSALAGISVGYVNREGVDTELGLPMRTEGTLTVEGIDADSAHVSVMGPLSVQIGTLTELRGEELYARLDLGAPSLTLRVVDGEGTPISGVLVRLTDSIPSPLYQVSSTGVDGTCSFRGLPERTLLVSLEHASHGQLLGAPIDGGAGEVELVLTSDAGIELLIRDGVEPLAGVEAKALVTAVGPRWTALGSSDAAGRVAAVQLSEGLYRITTEHPDCWPTTIEAKATNPPTATDVQVRRRGALLFEVRTGEGAPIGSASVDMRSVEFSERVATWVDQGLLGPPRSLLTDQQGRLRIEGLPRGSYTWFVALAGDTRAAGSCEVPPGGMAEVRVLAP